MAASRPGSSVAAGSSLSPTLSPALSCKLFHMCKCELWASMFLPCCPGRTFHGRTFQFCVHPPAALLAEELLHYFVCLVVVEGEVMSPPAHGANHLTPRTKSRQKLYHLSRQHQRHQQRSSREGGTSSATVDTPNAAQDANPTLANEDGDSSSRRRNSRFSANLTAEVLVLAVLVFAVLAFLTGTIFRAILQHVPPIHPHPMPTAIDQGGTCIPKQIQPPKENRRGSSTTKLFQPKAAVTSHSVHLNLVGVGDEEASASTVPAPSQSLHRYLTTSEQKEEDKRGPYLPSGQHLFVDIKNVDSDFLNSEERLAQAMIDLVKAAEVTLLSYHCHSLVPMGVKCAGVILESHIALHTWPKDGVIVLDLYHLRREAVDSCPPCNQAIVCHRSARCTCA